jgi:hypothetical protein
MDFTIVTQAKPVSPPVVHPIKWRMIIYSDLIPRKQ